MKNLVPAVTAGVLHWRLTTPLSAQLVTCQPATLLWAATMRLLSKASRPCRQSASGLGGIKDVVHREQDEVRCQKVGWRIWRY